MIGPVSCNTLCQGLGTGDRDIPLLTRRSAKCTPCREPIAANSPRNCFLLQNLEGRCKTLVKLASLDMCELCFRIVHIKDVDPAAIQDFQALSYPVANIRRMNTVVPADKIAFSDPVSAQIGVFENVGWRGQVPRFGAYDQLVTLRLICLEYFTERVTDRHLSPPTAIICGGIDDVDPT